MMYGQANIR